MDHLVPLTGWSTPRADALSSILCYFPLQPVLAVTPSRDQLVGLWRPTLVIGGAEMEKDARSARVVCANFSQLCFFLFVFYAVFAFSQNRAKMSKNAKNFTEL